MRNVLRLLCLAAAVALALLPPALEQYEWLKEHAAGFKLDKTYSVILPALSPVLGILPAVATLTVTWLTLLCLPVLVIAVFKGRWFCRYICPMGFLAELTGKLRLPFMSRIKPLPFVNRYLLAVMAGSAVVGYPLFLWLDPLSIFNGCMSIWHKPLTWLGAIPAAGFVFIIIISYIHPANWCYRICPLGYTQEFMRELVKFARRRLPAKEAAGEGAAAATQVMPVTRSQFLSVILGGTAGWVMTRDKKPPKHMRPPGAVAEDKFTAMCARCGNCVNTCPAKILHHDWIGTTGWEGVMTPVLVIEPDCCYEWCNDCSKVCPTQAIRRVTLDEKKMISIGVAEVTKRHCIAWHNQEHCMVCQEHCPYVAIKIKNRRGVPCPVVDEDKCRGCGICQKACPALTKAIVVRGYEQKVLKE